MPETKKLHKAASRTAVDSDVSTQPTQPTQPFWSGTISFGLVSVPVNLFPANRGSRASLRMLGPDDEPLHRQFYSEKTGRELEEDDIVRGYETDKGKHIVVTDEELERLAPEKSRDIDLRLFVDQNSIPPQYFERGYFLAPAGGSNKAYRLLAGTMERRGKAGIATFVMREREYLVAIISKNGILRAATMRFNDELRSPSDVGLRQSKRAPAKSAVRRFETTIAKKSKKALPVAGMHDERAAQLLKLVRKKEPHPRRTAGSTSRKKPEQVVDLMEILRKSLKAV